VRDKDVIQIAYNKMARSYDEMISLRKGDYIYECNKGRHINFAATEAEAIERLSK
jgi:hypothetical protein